VGLVLASAQASGTERRVAFVYRHLVKRFPDRYRLLIAPNLFEVLNEAGYALDRLEGVDLLPRRSRLDRKRGAHAPPWVNAGRTLTMLGYRSGLRAWASRFDIDVIQVYLELVPFLGLFPIRHLPTIVSLVSHLPVYFDKTSAPGRLLLRAAGRALKADCHAPIVDGLRRLGVPEHKLNWPHCNTTNHEIFHPVTKEPLVSFTARSIWWKNPDLMADVIGVVLDRHPSARFAVLGEGPLQAGLRRLVQERGWTDKVLVEYRADPSDIVNRSLVHVSIEELDNASNQSLLEGMAAGCAVVASDVGATRQVVTPDVGVLTSLEPDDVAGRVIDLLDHPDHAEALGRAARERILRDHHVDRYVEYLRLLHDFSRSEPVQDGRRITA
jgi:glycosyltransferase involved in cell wall biosynthesis